MIQTARSIAASESSLFQKFRDRLDPTRFRRGKGDRIAGMQRVQRQAVLCLELFGSTVCVCLIATLPLIRSTLVTVPVSVCWAKAAELMMVSAAPAKMIFAIFMAVSRFLDMRDKPRWPGLVPAQEPSSPDSSRSDCGLAVS